MGEEIRGDGGVGYRGRGVDGDEHGGVITLFGPHGPLGLSVCVYVSKFCRVGTYTKSVPPLTG